MGKFKQFDDSDNIARIIESFSLENEFLLENNSLGRNIFLRFHSSAF